MSAPEKTLLLITARNDQTTVAATIESLHAIGWTGPAWLVDDASNDRTYPVCLEALGRHPVPGLRLYRNDLRQGVGGTQKMAFRYALEAGLEAIVVCPASQGGAVSHLPTLLAAAATNPEPACWLGDLGPSAFSRLTARALNALCGAPWSAWWAPLRLYRADAMRKIAFSFNTNDSHFETEVLLQLMDQNLGIREVLLPGAALTSQLRWDALWHSLKAALKYRMQQYNLFYDVRYHPEILVHRDPNAGFHKTYEQKLTADSPHAFVCQTPDLIRNGSRVLDIGCSKGYVADWLAQNRQCDVVGIDALDPSQVQSAHFRYFQMNLETDWPRLGTLIKEGDFDVILMLDVLEHLAIPELFLSHLVRVSYRKPIRFVFSTGNVSFFVIRLMLLWGYFNYGEKGILDITHKRLFSWRTFRNLFDQTGFLRLSTHGFPMPYRALGFSDGMASFLEKIHRFLVRLRPSLFAYQILVVVTPLARPRLASPSEISIQ